jgi:iron complex transport system ATP-binding protein
MLAAERVGFAFGRTPVLVDVSVSVARGSIVGVLGPNGSGKTTLLRILAGTLVPRSGSVSLDGRPFPSIGQRALARRIAVVPQDTHPTFDYTALDIVLMGRYPWLGAFEVEGPDDLAAATDALVAAGTAHLASRSFATLSGGEKQRIIIASALAQLDRRRGEGDASSILILDEPTTALDLKYQLEVTSLVRRLHQDRNVTVVLSTHDLRLASSLCSHLVLLSEGRVQARGPAAEMLTRDRVSALYGVDRALVPVVPG